MKIAIVYCSKFQGNTKKLLDVLAEKEGVELFRVSELSNNQLPNQDQYDIIGLASGIYAGQFHRTIRNYVKHLEYGTKVFLIYTYGNESSIYTNSVIKRLNKRQCSLVGEFGCRAYSPIPVSKKIGEETAGRPGDDDFLDLTQFFDKLIEENRSE